MSMSATLQNRRPPSPEVAAPGPCTATLALSRVEGRRLLRHPLVLVGVELSLFLHLRTVVAAGQVPVVPRDDVAIVSAIACSSRVGPAG